MPVEVSLRRYARKPGYGHNRPLVIRSEFRSLAGFK
jgi:hypothetical protein